VNTADKLGVDKKDLYTLSEFLIKEHIGSLSPETNEVLINLSFRLGQIKLKDIPEEVEDELFAYIKAVDLVAKTNTCHQMLVLKKLGEAVGVEEK